MNNFFVNYNDFNIENLNSQFKNSAPFRHLVIDNFLNIEHISQLIDDFPKEDSPYIHSSNFYTFKGKNTIGRFVPLLYQKFFDEVTSATFVNLIEKLTGIRNLKADVEFKTGGLELGTPGAFSKLHTDPFLHYHNKKWFSQITVLIYLSDPWLEKYHGQLEIWDIKKKQKIKSISPIQNRCVTFQNSELSYHGYPTPIAQPSGVYRRAILLWYYIEKNKIPFRPIRYFETENHLMKKSITFFENILIWFYTFLRLHFKFDNSYALKIGQFLRSSLWAK